MGTSKGYIPPTTIKWSQAKRAVTGYINNRDNSSMSNAAAKFATAMKADSSFATFSRATGTLVSFSDNIKSNGLSQALRDFGREDLIGKDPEEIFDALLSDFTNAGSTTEDYLAAQAIGEALNILGVDDMVKLPDIDTDVLLTEILSEYLKYSFSFRYSEQISKGRNSVESNNILQEIERYIVNKVHNDFDKSQIKEIDFHHMESSKIVENLLRDALSIFEDFYEGE